MSIRAKIFALAGILLLLFGLVLGIFSVLQAATVHKLEGIVSHYQPIRRLLADLDVETDEYELRVERLRRQPESNEAALRAAVEATERVGNRIRENFDKLHARLDAAVAHSRGHPDDLRELASAQGALPFIERQVDPFLLLGRQVMDAIVAGRPEEAQRLALGFTQFENAFGPDLADMRQRMATLTEKASAGIYGDQRLNMWLSFVLFLIASAVGLGVSGIGSGQVVHALRKLLASAKAIEAGQADIMVPVLTRDEVGELARAFNRMIGELRQREQIKDTFGKFVDPRIVSRLIGSGDNSADAAERKAVTIFFSDIQGFSGIGEQLTAAATVSLLNAYFTAATDEIRRHNGIIDKYIGDSIMAFWCAPFSPGDEHAADGCRAALAQLRALAELRERLPELTGLRRNAPDLVVRMALASGEAVVGAIGSPNARSFTVIGDTVNLASRLEGVNKLYRTSVILSENTYRLSRHGIEARELDIVTVAGKSEPIRIYELMGEIGALDPTRAELRDTFAAGLDAYRRRDWDTAEQDFKACRHLVPDDGPSAVFLERVARFRQEPPPGEWDGVWHLVGK